MTADLKGLSLTQPWATLIAVGAKTIETRGWWTPYRGPVAIHASRKFPKDEQALCHRDPFATALIDAGIGFSKATDLPLGAIVAVAQLYDCRRSEEIVRSAEVGSFPLDKWAREQAFGNFEPGRYGFFLSDVRRLRKPITCKGALSLWAVPPEVVAGIAQQLGRAA